MPDPYRLDDEDPLTIDRTPTPSGSLIAQAQLQEAPNVAPAPPVADVGSFAQRAPEQAPAEVAAQPDAPDPYARPVVEEPTILHQRRVDDQEEAQVQRQDQVRAQREQVQEQRQANQQHSAKMRGLKAAGVEMDVDVNTGETRPRTDDKGNVLYKPAVIDPFHEDETGVYSIKRDAYGKTHKVPLKPKLDPATGEKFVIGEDGVTKKSLGIDESFIEKRDAEEAGKISGLAKSQLAGIKSKQKELKDREKAITEEIALNSAEKTPTAQQQIATERAKADLLKIRAQMAPLQKQHDDFATQADAFEAEHMARRSKVVARAQADYAARNPGSAIALANGRMPVSTTPPAEVLPAGTPPPPPGINEVMGSETFKAAPVNDRVQALRGWIDEQVKYRAAVDPTWNKEKEKAFRGKYPDRGGVLGSLAELGTGLRSALLDQFPEDVARISRGGDVSLHGDAWQDHWIAEQEADKQARGTSIQQLAGSKLAEALQQGPASIVTSAATGLAGAKIGVVAAAPFAAAAGAGTAGVGAVGAEVVGAMAGAAAMSGVSFYRLAKDQFVDQVRQQVLANDPKMTEEKWAVVRDVINPKAREYGLWEAGPEAVSQAFTAGLFSAGGKAARAVLKGAGVGEETLAKLAKNTVLGIGAKYGSEIGEELATETVTQIGQGKIEESVGLRDKAPDWASAFSEVAGPTIVGALLQGGGAHFIEHVKEKRAETKAAKEETAAYVNEWNEGNAGFPGFVALTPERAPIARAATAAATTKDISDRWEAHGDKLTRATMDVAEAQASGDPAALAAATAARDTLAQESADLSTTIKERSALVVAAMGDLDKATGGEAVKAGAVLKAAGGERLTAADVAALRSIKDASGNSIIKTEILSKDRQEITFSDTAADTMRPTAPNIAAILDLSRPAPAAVDPQQAATTNATATNPAENGPVQNQPAQAQANGQSQGQGESANVPNGTGPAAATTGPAGANVPAGNQTLPAQLAGAKPRYSYKDKRFDLQFANDLDKAAYIAAQPTRSKSDGAFVKHVMDATGMSEPEVRAHGAKVRDSIKKQAADAQPGALTVEDQKPTRGSNPAGANTPPAVQTEQTGATNPSQTQEAPQAPRRGASEAKPPRSKQSPAGTAEGTAEAAPALPAPNEQSAQPQPAANPGASEQSQSPTTGGEASTEGGAAEEASPKTKPSESEIHNDQVAALEKAGWKYDSATGWKTPKGSTVPKTRDAYALLVNQEANNPEPEQEAPVSEKRTSTQLTLSPKEAGPFIDFAKSIDPADLYTEEEGYGIEEEPHITALYGLDTQDPADARKVLENFGPVKVNVGNATVFENDKYDVLKFDIGRTPELKALRAKLETLPFKSDFPDYQPHLTVAYLKKGRAQKYAGFKRGLSTQQLTFNSLTFSNADRQKEQIELAPKTDEAKRTAEERAQRLVSKAMNAGKVKRTLDALSVRIGGKSVGRPASFLAGYDLDGGTLGGEPKLFLRVDSQRIGEKTAGMTDAQTEEYITAALSEEVTHLAQYEAVRRKWVADGRPKTFGAVFTDEYADVFQKMSAEEKAAARAAYGRDIDGAELGAEFVRQLIQQGSEGRITEATHAAKPIIERILAVLRELLSNPAARSEALQRAFDSTTRVLSEIDGADSSTSESPASGGAPQTSDPATSVSGAAASDQPATPPPASKQGRKAKQPKPKAVGTTTSTQADTWKLIGKNKRGNEVYEDARGVRSYVDNGVRVTESVGIIPGGGISVKSADEKDADYRTVEDSGPTAEKVAATQQKPSEVSGPKISAEADKALDDAFEGLFASEPENREVLNAEKALEKLDEFDAADPDTWPRNLGRGVEQPDPGNPETWKWALQRRDRTFLDEQEASFTWDNAAAKWELDEDADEEADLARLNRLRMEAEEIFRDRQREAKARAADLRRQVEQHGFLYASEPVEQKELPEEKIGAFVSAARALIASGIETPAAMASALEAKFAGKARPFSEALWDAFGMVKKSLRGTHDWNAVYASLAKSNDQANTTTNETQTANSGDAAKQPPADEGEARGAGEVEAGSGRDQSSADVAGGVPKDDGASRPAETDGSAGGDAAGGGTPGSEGDSENGAPAVGRKSRKSTARANPDDAGNGTSVAGGNDDRPVSLARSNYHLTNPEKLVGGGPKARFKRNQDALETFQRIQVEQREPTPAELDTMAAYMGWGSFGQELFQGTWERSMPASGWEKENEWLRDHLSKQGWQSAQESIINAHYTDPPTVEMMWRMVHQLGFKGGRVLEPSMGVGNFFALMPRDLMANSELTGIEMDMVVGGIAKMLYPRANVQVKGYQDSLTADNFYDLVIGNWPFAKDGPSDRRYNNLALSLHDYFFVKALDQVRPGGFVIGITSSGTMDKKGETARRQMAKRAELVASFRLPTGAFEKYAGTKVVTDLIILQKREQPLTEASGELWIGLGEVEVRGGAKVATNQYYIAHPENILGELAIGSGTTFGRAGMIVNRQSNFPEVVAKLQDKLPADLFKPWTPREGKLERTIANTEKRRQNAIVHVVDRTDAKENGFYVVRGEQLVNLEDVRAWRLKDKKETAAREADGRSLIGISDALTQLLDEQRRNDPDTNKTRARLKGLYEAHVSAHGHFADSTMLDVFTRAGDPSARSLRNLETWDGKAWQPRDILSKDIMRRKTVGAAGNVSDAYIMSRNDSITLDLDRVAELAKIPKEDVIKELVALDQIYQGPDRVWYPREEYLGGNVRQKLREALDAKDQGIEMDRNIAALESIQPKDIPYLQIEVQMGAAWVPKSDYVNFAAHLLGVSDITSWAAGNSVNITKAMSGWDVRIDSRQLLESPNATTKWGIARHLMPFSKILQAAMNGTALTVTAQDENKKTYTLTEETKQVNAKIDAIREEFAGWLWREAERTGRLTRDYNETLNAEVNPQRSGAHLRLEGLALSLGKGEFDFRQHQKDAVWRFLQDGRGVAFHEVGTGKTFTIAGLAMEGRRLGRFRKPILFAHNANHRGVAADMSLAYPGAKVLHIDNLSPEHRDDALRQIGLDDWDLIVMPHSLLDRFTLRGDTLMEMAREEIAQLENEIYAAAADADRSLEGVDLDDDKAVASALARATGAHTAKNLVKMRKRIIKRIQDKAAKAEKAGALLFEELGIDAIMVDEAHMFKKVALATRKNLKGLNKEESGRGWMLNALSSYVKRQNSGKGVFLFTGTPLTNNLNEAFTMMQFVMDDVMESAKVKSFDDWFNSFAAATTDVELTSGGTLEPVTRLLSFVNVPELARLASRFFDVVLAKDMPEFVERTSMEGMDPDAVGRPHKKMRAITADMSPAQAAFKKRIEERYKEYQDLDGKGKRLRALKGEDTPVMMDGDGAKSAMDHRMITREAKDDFPGSKLNKMVRQALTHFHEHEKATQAIFMENGFNDYTDNDEAIRGADGMPIRNDEGETLRTKVRRPAFNLVRDIVEKLVAGGVDPSEIAVLSNMKLDAADKRIDDVLRKVVREGIRHPAIVRTDGKSIEKDDIAAAAREGKIRFLIGSTQTLGTGVNAQTYMRAMHHLDAPWTPGEFEQRNGRGWRQGNVWNTVNEYRYFTEGSHDGRRWQVLLNKVRFINRFTEMLRGGGGERVLTGDGADLGEGDGNVADFADSFSTAVGDPRIQIRAKLDADVKKLTDRRSTFLRGLEDAKERGVNLGRDIIRQKKVVENWTALLEAYRKDQAAAPGQFSITVGDKKFTERKKAEDRIAELPSFIKSGVVGKIGSFDVYFDEKRTHGGMVSMYDTAFSLRLPGSDTQIDLSKFSVAAIEAQLRMLPQRVDTFSRRVEELTAQQASLREMQGQTFSRQDELDKKETALKQIKAEMDRSPLPAPAWLRNGVPVGSLVYLEDKKAYDVVAHRRDDSGYWLLIEDDGVMRPVRYLDVYDEAGTRIFDPVEEPAGNSKEAPKEDPSGLSASEPATLSTRALQALLRKEFPTSEASAASESGVISQVAGIKAGTDGYWSVIPPMDDSKAITTGPFASEYEAQAFIDAEVGSDAVQIVEVRGGRPVSNPFAAPKRKPKSYPPSKQGFSFGPDYYQKTGSGFLRGTESISESQFNHAYDQRMTQYEEDQGGSLAASEPLVAGPEAKKAPAPETAHILEAAMKDLPPVERKVLAMKLRDEPIATIMRVTKLNEKGVQNAYDIALGKMRRARAQAEKVGAVFARALAEKQPNTIGRPDLANPATGPKARRFVDAVDADRGETATREQKGVRDESAARLDAGYAKERSRLLAAAQKGESFGDLDTAMAKQIVSREALRAVKAGTLDRVYEAAQFVNAYRMSGTEQARGLAMRRDWTKDPAERVREFVSQALLTPPQKQRKRMEDKPERANEELKDWARQMKRLKQRLKDLGFDLDNMTDDQITDFLKDRVKAQNVVKTIADAKSDVWDALYEYWVSSILSGPATNVANVAGNAANALWDFTAQRFMEATVNLAANDPGAATFGEMKHIWAGFLPGMADGFRRALRSWREEMPVFEAEILGGESTGDVHGDRAIPGKLGRIVRAPLRLLLAADEMSKSVTARMQVGAEAYRLANEQGLKGDALRDFMREQMRVDPENPSQAWRAAASIARTLAFQNDLGGFGNSVVALRDSLPGLRYFMPFIKTIANIFKVGIKKSPLGSAGILYRLGKGAVDLTWNGGWSYTRKEAITDAAEQMLAWGMFFTLSSLAAPDDDDDLPTITGTVPYQGTKKGERDLAYRTAPPQSIRIQGEWYAYNRIEPFATALGVMVDGLNTIRKAENNGDYTKAIGRFFQHMTAQLKDKTFARGIGDILNAIEDGASLTEWVGNFATSWVPNIVRASVRETDDMVREQRVWGRGEEWGARMLDRVEYRAFPIEANAPPAKVDLWGREIEKDKGASPATDFLYRLISPAKMQPANDVLPVDRLIVNWNNAHPDEVFAPQPPEPKWDKSFGPKGAKQEKTIFMSDGEYNRFLQMSGRMALARVNAEGLNIDKPTRADLEKIDKALSESRKAARDKLWEEHTVKH